MGISNADDGDVSPDQATTAAGHDADGFDARAEIVHATDSETHPLALLTAELPQPINWNQLDADEAETAWEELNEWVDWLRRTYAVPASVVPPYWHRHPELVWELSALHLHWLSAYHPDQHASAPFGWHRDFADARQRLREWVAQSGTHLDHDRPLRRTPWPGESSEVNSDDRPPINTRSRDNDFAAFVINDVGHRHRTRQLRS